MRHTRRRYVVEIDVDGVPGWNDRTRPDDMRVVIERWLVDGVGHYNPTVTYEGEVEE